MNPQLKCLRLIIDLPRLLCAKEFHDVKESLQNLENFYFNGDTGSFYHQFSGEIMRLKSLKTISLNIRSSSSRSSLIMPFVSDQLKTLTLKLNEIFGEKDYNLIDKNPTVTKLEIEYWDSNETKSVNLSRLAKGLPLLEQLFLEKNVNMKIDNVIHSSAEFQSLKEISFYHWGLCKYQDLMPLLNNGWSGTIEDIDSEKNPISVVHLKQK